MALRSHYLFEAEFCRVGIKGAPEKGGVESGVGRFRRNHLVPIPTAENFDDLNGQLLRLCGQDDQRQIVERQQIIWEDWMREVPLLRALPSDSFPTAEVGTAEVDRKGRVCLRTNRYSAPIRLCGLRVEYRLGATKLELVHQGRTVAVHHRLEGRHGQRLELDHYLELLWRKPGALSRSLPLRQVRERGQWPDEYDELWSHLRLRYGESEGTKHLLEVLLMHREADVEEVHTAVGLALEYGCYDSGAIAQLLRQLQVTEPEAAPLVDLGVLARYEHPVDRGLRAIRCTHRPVRGLPGGPLMTRTTPRELEARTVESCRELKLPAVARDAARRAIEATRQGSDPLAYLVQLRSRVPRCPAGCSTNRHPRRNNCR